jgi:hypothetical protein
MRGLLILIFVLVSQSCGVYSPYGAATSGASTFSITYFQAVHPLVSATTAINLSEALIDRVQRQSTLKLTDNNGELRFEGKVIGWVVQPINVQGDETAGANRITVTVDVIFTNTIDSDLSFQRKFSRFVIFSNEDIVVKEVASLISQDVFNASLGNW